jgi:site-specific DNA-methyltransferase (adenine-specific)
VRKVVIGDATLYHGDCLEVIPRLPAVDIVVTSPPFNQFNFSKPSGMNRNSKWVARAVSGYADTMPEQAYQTYIRRRLDQCFKKCQGLLWLHHKVRYRKGVGLHPLRIFDYPLHAEIIWDRMWSMALNAKRFAPSHEGFYAFGVPHYWNSVNDASLQSVWRIKSTGDKLHPCVFPEKLIKPIIIASCPRGGIVLDPFAGTGRTGIVALKNSRRCILIEKQKKYFDRMCHDIKALYAAA